MKKVTVIGAGIIGICCALEAQRLGFAVTLLDRNEPAQGASFGNAGVLATNAIAPYASSGLLSLLPKYGLNLDPKFQFHWPHAFALAPWLLRFIKNCNATSYRKSVESLSYIVNDAVTLHRELLKQCDQQNIIVERGWLRLYRSENSFESSTPERQNFDEFGIPYEILDSAEICELEPDIKRRYTKGILLPESVSVTHPQKLCLAYFSLFKNMGGEFIQSSVSEIRKSDTTWNIRTDDKTMQSEKVVVAMGAQTPSLLKPLDIKIPMAIERGYHLAFAAQADKKPTRSFIDMEQGLVMTPMDFGIRVTSAVNLIARETEPTFKQILNLRGEMHSIFPLGEQLTDEPWIGHRPSTPDSMPVIGKAPGFEDLWLAFGHGHVGLTLGPKTGLLIASAMAGKKLDDAADAFSPKRFL